MCFLSVLALAPVVLHHSSVMIVCNSLGWLGLGLAWPHGVWPAQMSQASARNGEKAALNGNKFPIHSKNNPCRTKFIPLLFYVFRESQ